MIGWMTLLKVYRMSGTYTVSVLKKSFCINHIAMLIDDTKKHGWRVVSVSYIMISSYPKGKSQIRWTKPWERDTMAHGEDLGKGDGAGLPQTGTNLLLLGFSLLLPVFHSLRFQNYVNTAFYFPLLIAPPQFPVSHRLLWAAPGHWFPIKCIGPSLSNFLFIN